MAMSMLQRKSWRAVSRGSSIPFLEAALNYFFKSYVTGVMTAILKPKLDAILMQVPFFSLLQQQMFLPGSFFSVDSLTVFVQSLWHNGMHQHLCAHVKTSKHRQLYHCSDTQAYCTL